MDIASMLVGKSDQLDNVDLIAGPRDFTITGVTAGAPDQPLNIALAEFPRPWRPGLTMRRILAGIWGTDASTYVGRRVRLYRDETVTFGKKKPGGTRISHASNIDAKVTLTLPTSRGEVGTFTIEPLVEAAADPSPRGITPEQVAGSSDRDELKTMWKQTQDKELRALIEARVSELSLPQSSADVDPNQGTLA